MRNSEVNREHQTQITGGTYISKLVCGVGEVSAPCCAKNTLTMFSDHHFHQRNVNYPRMGSPSPTSFAFHIIQKGLRC